MENNHLDKRIREMMENLEGEFQVGHWEQMEQLLNDPANADLSENDLDHSLRNKLTDVEPAFAAAHWDLFEQQLDTEIDTPEIEDVYLDGVTYELLNDLQTPYNSDHWTLMQKRLEEEFSLRYKLVKYKVAELALLALALFTIVSYLPQDKVSAFRLPIAKKSTLAKKATTKSAETLQSLENISPNVTSGIGAEETALQAGQQQALISLNTDNNTSLESEVSNTAGSTKRLTSTPPNDGAIATATTVELIKDANLVIAAVNANSTAKDKSTELSNKLPLDTEEAASSLLDIADILEEQLQIIPIIKGLEISPLPEKSNNIISGISTDIWKGPSFLRIGMFGAGEANYIMTPYNEEYDQAAINTFESGYGGGISLGFKFGRWEIETGAIYSNKYYNPDTINVTINAGNIGYGYEGLAWASTQLDVLRVPVRARYDFAKKGKWHVYTQAGLAANLTLNKIHSREVVPLSNFPQETPLRSPQRSPLAPISPVLNKVDAPEVTESIGLLKSGGSLQDNHYFTAELGFGIERYLSSRFSFFAQPTFHYQLGQSNIGLNKERINTFSVESGIRVSLKRYK